MPFGPYEDFSDCVSKNQDKEDPEGYCSILQEILKNDNKKREATMTTETAQVDEALEYEEEEEMEADFHSLIILEAAWTGDGRYFEPDSLTWRDLPLPLMALDKTTEAHLEARLVGNFTRIERQGLEIHGWGVWVESDDPEVMRLQALVQRGELRGLSADLDDVEMEMMMGDEEDRPMMVFTRGRVMGATVVPFPALQEAFIESTAVLMAALMQSEEVTGHISFQNYEQIDFRPPAGAREEAQRGLDWRSEFGRGGTEVGIARARDIANGRNLSPSTVRRMSAFFSRHEQNKNAEGFSPGEDGFPSNGRIAWALWGGDAGKSWAAKIQRSMQARDDRGSITAAGMPIEAPLCPPKEWFDDPGLSSPTPMTVTDSGKIYGHIATWETCHVGFADQCVKPPRSASQYRHFTTGEILCEDGVRVNVGQITMDTGHAPLKATGARAAAHYDDTGMAVADVAAGEDRWGIWMSGALRPGVAPEKVRALMASDVSGDWRRIGSALELVGLLAVNVPGFPKLRESEGLVSSMVASLSPSAHPDALRRAADRIAATIGRSKAQRIEDLAVLVRKKKSE